jgi:hypothetical protein
MQFNKPVSNPMLVGSIELLKAEDTPEHRKMFEEEVLKAVFLAPVIVNPAPEPDEKGTVNIKPGSQVQFPMLSAPDGKRFFMAFSDWTELKKWKDEEGQQTFAMSFDDYMDMLFKKDSQGNINPAAGLVINPYGGNIAITKEMAMVFISDKMAKMKGLKK